MHSRNLWYRLLRAGGLFGIAGTIALTPYGLKVKAMDAQPQIAVNETKPDEKQKSGTEDRHKKFSALLEDAAEAIGIGKEELKKELKSGKSIAEVAKAKGVDEADLTDRLLASRMKKIDEAVKSGRWTEEQAERMRAKLPDHLRTIVRHKGEWKHHHKDKQREKHAR